MLIPAGSTLKAPSVLQTISVKRPVRPSSPISKLVRFGGPTSVIAHVVVVRVGHEAY
jgi:hypothetical protein